MSVEFEKAVMKKLDSIEQKIDTRLDSIETRLDSIETRLDSVETRLNSVETRLDSFETRLDSVETRLDSIEQKLDITTNVNIASILINQTNNHKELLRKISEYEKANNLEHSRLNYEICKLAANA